LSAFIRNNRQLFTAIRDPAPPDKWGADSALQSHKLTVSVETERLDRTQEVGGSNPPSSIEFSLRLPTFALRPRRSVSTLI
jgi:hypothetical protein